MTWFELFPDVSGELSLRLYDEALADAICAFAEQWPQTRAAICSIILKGTFKGPMQRLQEYVSASWSFAGIEHAERILEFLEIRYPWVVDVIPELQSKDHVLQEFLEVFGRLGADGPYMKLLHLPEAAKALREPLALHAAAAYALAVVEDWSQYSGVPQERAEEEVFLKVTRAAPPGRQDALHNHPVTERAATRPAASDEGFICVAVRKHSNHNQSTPGSIDIRLSTPATPCNHPSSCGVITRQ
ncbi:hypothetical protein MTO96_018377 [Rhipicephalus appendiculatus]